MTPQIITETLWALQQRGERVDEIRVITTLDGREKILTGKINGRGAADESLLDTTEGQFFKFLQDFPAVGPIIFDANCLYLLTTKQTGVPSPRDHDTERLSDILTDEDNEKAANQICEIVRDLAKDDNVRIHASIAGGRKTMGLYLMTAMQLFGRNEDKMSHVLVSKEVEFGAPKFFYKRPQPEPVLDFSGKPKTKPDGSVITSADINIYLADIPFIRLRGVGAKLLDKPLTNYGDFVLDTQRELEFLESAKELRLNLKEKKVKVFNREATLSLRQMFVYAMFAYFRKGNIGEDGYVGLDEITPSDVETICALFVAAEAGETVFDAFRSVQKRAGFIDSFLLSEVTETLLEEKRRNYRKHGLASPQQATVTKEEANKKVLKSYRETLDRITERLEEAKIDVAFDIARKGAKGGYIFGLKIEAARIKFE
jgi:CRISPR-associated protein (TIGR02584 family)